MPKIRHHKVVSVLPGTLLANSIYYVKIGSGFDIYVTNEIGAIVAFPFNKHGNGVVSQHSDVDTITSPPTSNKEVLKYDGVDIFRNNTLDLDDLDDVNTQQVTPEIGWILKHNGTDYVPCFRKMIRSSILKTTQNNGTNPVEKFSVDLNIQRPGDYAFDLKAGGSMNTQTTDLVGILYFNNQPLAVIANNEVFRVEFKDSAGNESDGRGTDQKGNVGNRLFANVSAIGTYNVRLEFFGSTNNDSASLFDVSCVVEEEFGIVDSNV